MRIDWFGAAIAIVAAAPGLAQIKNETSATVVSVSTPMPPSAPAALLLRKDTPIELLAPSEVRSDKAPPGMRFKLRVNKPVQVDGVTVIPVGAMAWGEVISADPSKGLGKSGALSARLLHVDHDGRQIALEGDSSAKGMGAGSAGLAVVFTGVVGLFHRGNNAKIKAGEIMTGFIAADTEFAPPSPPAVRAPPQPAQP